jgi:GntR family transcriptional regulator, carbon starvation induced regulator
MSQDTVPTLSETAFGRLRADILNCRFKPGQKLRIAELQEAYGIGMGPLREALSRLAATGIVIAQGQRGFRVAPVSPSDLLDLMKTRIWVEALALRSAIAHGNVDWEADIIAAGHRLSLGVDSDQSHLIYLDDDWERRHRHFHRVILSAAGGTYLLDLCETLYELTARYRRLLFLQDHPDRNVNAEHEAIMQAVLARDGERAVRLTENHLLETARAVLSADPATAADTERLIADVRKDVGIGLAGHAIATRRTRAVTA